MLSWEIYKMYSKLAFILDPENMFPQNLFENL